jgi:NADH-quinone oxidoreductase subunit N
MTFNDIFSILPLTALIVWALLMLLAGLFLRNRYSIVTPILAVIGLAGTAALALNQVDKPLASFGGMISVDGFSVFLDCLFLLSGLLAVAISPAYLKRFQIANYEFYPLLLLSVSGMMLMASATNLIIVFLALELLSIPLYILAGIARPRVESEEAALKYFLLGSFASGFVLFGISLLFAATAATGFKEILASVNNGSAILPLLIAGGTLLLVGLGFKVAVVPFHAWTPDVYQGAPSPVTAFMAVGAKAAGFAALLRVFGMLFVGQAELLAPIFAVLAALTMLVGNLMALVQTNLKRLMAFIGIAGAGYVLMAFVPFGNSAFQADSVASALFYLMAFTLASFGAWAILLSLEHTDGKGLDLGDLAGLGKRSPILAAALTLFMFSFTGIPLTLGFWGKFYLFRTVIEGGYVWLAVLGLLTSLMAAYYSLRVLVMMYFTKGEPELHVNYWTTVVAIFCALCVLVLSFLPGQLFELAAKAVFGV